MGTRHRGTLQYADSWARRLCGGVANPIHRLCGWFQPSHLAQICCRCCWPHATVDGMQNRLCSRGMRPRVPSAALAGLGQLQWFFGNVYEAAVDMPQLLVDAHPNREPRLLGAGSPVRYYVPVAPVTLAATGATLIDSWRSGGDRRMIATSAVSTAAAIALTAYLVRTVNLRLLHSGKPLTATEGRQLVRTWHRGNLVRLLALVVAAWTLRRASLTADSAADH
jgi:Domain of unknown function (DUF1772)